MRFDLSTDAVENVTPTIVEGTHDSTAQRFRTRPLLRLLDLLSSGRSEYEITS